MSHAICNLSHSPKSASNKRIQNARYFTIYIFFPNQTMPKKSKKKKLLSQLSYQDSPDQDVITDMQVACLLQQSYNEPTESPTITDIFGSSCSSSSVPFPGSPSVECDGDGLARRALRGRERWVFCASTDHFCASKGALSLKLDHEEVLTAWSDKGSLYIDGEGPQVVPELLESDVMEPNMQIWVDVGNGAGWRVPEMCGRESLHSSNGCWDRKERVMRYREKRQSRLYAKRIRYEVRKLNAEKRPRIKGRFVKRTDGESETHLVA